MFPDFLAPTHLLLIFIVALLVFGPKRLPELGKTLGKGLRDFRSTLNEYSPRELFEEEPEPPAADVPGLVPEPPAIASAAQAAPEPDDSVNLQKEQHLGPSDIPPLFEDADDSVAEAPAARHHDAD